MVYNRKKTARYIPYEKVGDEVIRHIKTELKKIYNNEDGVADGIAIEHGNDVYIVDSGRENGSTAFGVRRRRRISDARLRDEFIRSKNNDAISKRFVSDEISSRFGNGLGGDSGRNMRRESRTELQTDSRESWNNQVGVLGENADNGRVSDSDIRFNLHHDEAFYETEHGKNSSEVNRKGQNNSGFDENSKRNGKREGISSKNTKFSLKKSSKKFYTAEQTNNGKDRAKRLR